MLPLRLALRQDKTPCRMDGGAEPHVHYRTCPRSVFAQKPCPLLRFIPRKCRCDRLHSRSPCLCQYQFSGFILSRLRAAPLNMNLFCLFCLQSSNNITSHTKRAVQTATIVAAGGIGGIVATLVFRQKDFPRYVSFVTFRLCRN
jgi:hypothetical protein